MCLIVLGWHQHPDYPLVVAANRDEFYARPTAPLAQWDDAPQVVAGRDLEAGGTWLGVTHAGRFAAVTNVREPGARPGKLSRGELTRAFLTGNESPMAYLAGLNPGDFAGFNLLVSDGLTLGYLSNRGGAPRTLVPGIYGLSNHLLDSPWPKLLAARHAFAQTLGQLPDTDGLFSLLADDEIVPDGELPSTGVSLEWERLLSAIFVRSPNYGTRASTVLTMDQRGKIRIEERGFGAEGRQLPATTLEINRSKFAQ